MFYGWVIVTFALIVNGLSSGPVWSGVGVWIKALELHFGWSRAQLTGAFSMAQLEGSIIGPLMGYLIDRLGSRRMVLIGMIITGLGFLLFSRTGNIFVFYLSYGLIMLGTAAGTWLPYMTVVNRWFVRRRGLAMAIAAEGSPLGGLVLVPISGLGRHPRQSRLERHRAMDWRGVPVLGVAHVPADTGAPRRPRSSPRRRPVGPSRAGSGQNRRESGGVRPTEFHRPSGDTD